MNTPQRSDNLPPHNDEVAEEVNLDQQSEQARRVGHPPEPPRRERPEPPKSEPPPKPASP